MFGINREHCPIVSLVAGILGLSVLPGIGSVVAILVGRKCKNDSVARVGVVLGWIGLVLFLLSCCIAAVLVAVPLVTTSTPSSLLPVITTVV